jgi:hypothetical protein
MEWGFAIPKPRRSTKSREADVRFWRRNRDADDDDLEPFELEKLIKIKHVGASSHLVKADEESNVRRRWRILWGGGS